MFTHKEKVLVGVALGILVSQGFAQIGYSFDVTKDALVNSVEEKQSIRIKEDIISDEVDLTAAPEIEEMKEEEKTPLSESNALEEVALISDEVNLEGFDIEISSDIASLMMTSEKSYALASEIHSDDLNKLFTENTLRFEEVRVENYDIDDYIEKWEILQANYETKTQGIQLIETANFIEVYLYLSGNAPIEEDFDEELMWE